MKADVIEIAEYLLNNSAEGLIFDSVSDRNTQEKIIELNLGQLSDFKDSNGDNISDISGPYSLLTQTLKGVGPFDITFRDTGRYWETYTVEPINGGYVIDSNPIKEGEVITKWYKDVEGLTQENQDIANKLIEDGIWEKAQEKI